MEYSKELEKNLNSKKELIRGMGSAKEGQQVQLDLGMKEPFSQNFLKIKRDLSKNLVILETKKFYKVAATWIFIITSTAMLVSQYIVISRALPTLPNDLPLFVYTNDLERRLVTKEWLYSVPIATVTIILIMFLIGNKLYNSRQELIRFSLFTSVLSIFIMTFALIQLIANFI